jgi:cytochrome c6
MYLQYLMMILIGYANCFSPLTMTHLDLRKSTDTIAMSCSTTVAKASILGAVLFTTVPAFAGDAAAGEKVFNANCAACHVGGGNTIVADHTLSKSAIEKYLTGGFSESSVVNQVYSGKNAMPAFADRLSKDDINNVATYVITTSEDGWE